MQLKTYQTKTLDVLKEFFEASKIVPHQQAYFNITQSPEVSLRLGRLALGYSVLKTLPNTPRVCLKVPTGGGKTIMATHAIKIASETWAEREFPVVLWFVPSDTIRRQTLEAFKNPRHPYREALDEQFNGKVRIFDIDEKFNIRPSDIAQNACIIISTIQSFRQTHTAKYNVYKSNENLEPHFTHIKPTSSMEFDEAGKLKFSFSNLLNHHRPIMIVDEAHNVITGLSEDMQSRLNPSVIIEWTATPKEKNNTLYNVRATELKEEEMIKLPIVLTEHNNWELAVTEAISKRAELEKASSFEKEYIRPILLFQAQNIDGEVNVDTLKQHLINVHNIPESEIAIATGDQKELDGINLFDHSCLIKYIITVEALKEGWDCSFAYVLCSLANVKSDTSVEQLLGRVMRMPYAKSRKISALNKAYAYVVSNKFGESAEALVEKLASKGFSEEEARGVIEQAPPNFGLFGLNVENKIALNKDQKISQEDLPKTIKLEKLESGGEVLVLTPQTSPQDIEVIMRSLNETQVFELEYKYANYQKTLNRSSPASLGKKFVVPQMMIEIQGELKLADSDIVFEDFEWSLEEYAPFKLEPSEFKLEKRGNGFLIDIDNKTLKYSALGENQTEFSYGNVENWTEENLVRWLDVRLKDSYFSQGLLIAWLTKVISYLITERGLKMADLMIAKYALEGKLKAKIAAALAKAKQTSFQQSFLTRDSRIELDFNNGFEFSKDMYEGEILYQGSYKFQKHYLGTVPSFDGNQDGEEFKCAKVLDSFSGIDFWIRNVSRHPKSFWLPTSTDKFYPDLVAKLNDGKILVVEYKGAHLVENSDTKEKRAIGELWEKNSKGKGLFIIIEKTKNGLDIREQLEAKIK